MCCINKVNWNIFTNKALLLPPCLMRNKLLSARRSSLFTSFDSSRWNARQKLAVSHRTTKCMVLFFIVWAVRTRRLCRAGQVCTPAISLQRPHIGRAVQSCRGDRSLFDQQPTPQKPRFWRFCLWSSAPLFFFLSLSDWICFFQRCLGDRRANSVQPRRQIGTICCFHHTLRESVMKSQERKKPRSLPNMSPRTCVSATDFMHRK